ncbi:MAG: chorismate synthase [Deltaproteobacteria bacterium]|nr:chorismate synthase [Deltaproteobacteria bacterium]
MPGNTIGQAFRVTTFGESHGPMIGVVIDGCPSQLPLRSEDFIRDMARRRPGKSAVETPRAEKDRVEIASGVFKDLTTGAPITLIIHNQDVKSDPYEVLSRLFRPGHAEFTYFKKFTHFDYRGGGRSSARETAARVAAGVVADRILIPAGIKVLGYTLECGGIRAQKVDIRDIEQNEFFCPDMQVVPAMSEKVAQTRKEGDSLGGLVEVRVWGCPAGLGEPVFDKLDAELAKAVLSIGAVKGVEFGAGFAAAGCKGSQNNDPLTPDGFRTNNAGGILGGISNGDEIVLRVPVKPIPSIYLEQDTIDRQGNPDKLKLTGRYDVSAIPRVIPVLEAMVKIVLVDHLLRWKSIR